MKVGGFKTSKKLTIGVQQLVRLIFNNNFINPGLVLQRKTKLGIVRKVVFIVLVLTVPTQKEQITSSKEMKERM